MAALPYRGHASCKKGYISIFFSSARKRESMTVGRILQSDHRTG